jgi:hypothetical protein
MSNVAHAKKPTTEVAALHRALWRFVASELRCFASHPDNGRCSEASPSRPHLLLCNRHGREWVERVGFCVGWKDDGRLQLESSWVRRGNLAISPVTVDQARPLARRGLGRLKKGTDGKPVWHQAIHIADPIRRAA